MAVIIGCDDHGQSLGESQLRMRATPAGLAVQAVPNSCLRAAAAPCSFLSFVSSANAWVGLRVDKSSRSKALIAETVLGVRGLIEILGEPITVLVTVTATGVPVDILKEL